MLRRYNLVGVMAKTETERRQMSRMIWMFLMAFAASVSYVLVVSLFGWHGHQRQNPLALSAFSLTVAAFVFLLATYSEKYRGIASIGSGPIRKLLKWLIV